MGITKKPYKGTRDLFPNLKRKQQFLFDTMRKTAEQFCFEPYDGPLLEEVDLYRAKSGEELINEQIYSFIDRGEREVAIRPEMTPTVARMVAQIHRETPKPIKWFSIPNLMRYERPQKGRLREHWQFNCDIFGAPDSLGELEILEIAVQLFKNFGANNSHFEILINDRRVVDAIFNQAMGLASEQSYKLYKIVDRAKKVDEAALDKMMSEVLDDKQKTVFKEYLALSSLEDLKLMLEKYKLSDATQSFNEFYQLMEKSAVFEFISYDPTIVRGLDYYTGLVFEIFDKHPENRRALCGGGAYANLLKIFNEEPLAGVGFGLGDVTLLDFLEIHELIGAHDFQPNDLFITYQTNEAHACASKLAYKLRAKGKRVDLNLGELKMKKVFSTAQKKQVNFLALIGEHELKDNKVQIKNTQTREAKDFDIDDIASMIQFIG